MPATGGRVVARIGLATVFARATDGGAEGSSTPGRRLILGLAPTGRPPVALFGGQPLRRRIATLLTRCASGEPRSRRRTSFAGWNRGAGARAAGRRVTLIAGSSPISTRTGVAEGRHLSGQGGDLNRNHPW